MLGNYYGQQQPSQKYFESELYQKLQFEFSPCRPVWVEYESFKIGNITVPKKISSKGRRLNIV